MSPSIRLPAGVIAHADSLYREAIPQQERCWAGEIGGACRTRGDWENWAGLCEEHGEEIIGDLSPHSRGRVQVHEPAVVGTVDEVGHNNGDGVSGSGDGVGSLGQMDG